MAELGSDLGPFSRDTVILAAMLAPLCDRDYVYGNGERKRAPMTRDSIKMLWKVCGRMLQSSCALADRGMQYAKMEAAQIMDMIESALEWVDLVGRFGSAPTDELWISAGKHWHGPARDFSG